MIRVIGIYEKVKVKGNLKMVSSYRGFKLSGKSIINPYGLVLQISKSCLDVFLYYVFTREQTYGFDDVKLLKIEIITVSVYTRNLYFVKPLCMYENHSKKIKGIPD